MDDLIQIVYVSSAVKPFRTAELRLFLLKIRTANTARGLTGMLLYRDGNFIQALEGREEQVHMTFDRICRDPRHRGIIKLLEQPIVERAFADWSMGFSNLDKLDLSDLPGYFSLFSNELPEIQMEQLQAEKAKIAFRFLRQFAQP